MDSSNQPTVKEEVKVEIKEEPRDGSGAVPWITLPRLPKAMFRPSIMYSPRFLEPTYEEEVRTVSMVKLGVSFCVKIADFVGGSMPLKVRLRSFINPVISGWYTLSMQTCTYLKNNNYPLYRMKLPDTDFVKGREMHLSFL